MFNLIEYSDNYSKTSGTYGNIVPTISPPLISLTTCIHGTVFSTFLFTETSSPQFGTQPFAEVLLYFDILK